MGKQRSEKSKKKKKSHKKCHKDLRKDKRAEEKKAKEGLRKSLHALCSDLQDLGLAGAATTAAPAYEEEEAPLTAPFAVPTVRQQQQRRHSKKRRVPRKTESRLCDLLKSLSCQEDKDVVVKDPGNATAAALLKESLNFKVVQPKKWERQALEVRHSTEVDPQWKLKKSKKRSKKAKRVRNEDRRQKELTLQPARFLV